MDRVQFDRLSRIVAAASTRRDALRLLVAGALAGAVGGAGTTEARKRRGRGRQRDRGRVTSQQVPVCTNLCVNCGSKPIGPGKTLSKCDFDGESFVDGFNLSSANLANACFAETELRGALFNSANAGGVCFREADLTGASFRSASVAKAVFCGASLLGADFRGSNVTAAQLACATVGCTTILPNGKPAVTCGADHSCCDGECINTQTNPRNCGACGNHCGPCKTCVDGQCVNEPDNTIACDGSALRPLLGGEFCTASTGTGICINGACSCGLGIYDQNQNACLCSQTATNTCAYNQQPSQCCEVFEVCSDGSTSFHCLSCEPA